MATTRHTLAQLEGSGALLLSFKILDTGGTPTIDQVSSPQPFASDVTIVDSGVGRYAITINPFKGPVGAAHAIATAMTVGCIASITTAPTYTNDSLAFGISVNSGLAYADASVFCHVKAY